MPSALTIARSGLEVAGLALATSASNVANAETAGYVPRRVEARALPDGGVTAEVAPAANPVAEARADQALLAPSRTDLAQEVLAQRRAALAYAANAATVATADEGADALMDLLG